MNNNSSRRNFIATGLALPVAGLASASLPSIPAPAVPAAAQQGSALSYRTIGKTGLKVTSVGFGCMITSDQSVVEKGRDMGINYFDTARGYQNGNNERMVGAALKSKRKNMFLSTKTQAPNKQGGAGPSGHQPERTGRRTTSTSGTCTARASIAQVTDDLIDAQQTAKKAGQDPFRRRQHALEPGDADPGDCAERDARRHSDGVQLHHGPGPHRSHQRRAKAGVGIIGMKVMAGGTAGW